MAVSRIVSADPDSRLTSPKTERIAGRHSVLPLGFGDSRPRPARQTRRGKGIKKTLRLWDERSDPSAVPPTFGDAALWPTGRALGALVALPTPADRCCPLSLALCAGAYWRALEARGLVRRLTGPFSSVAAPACTNRWFSTPAPGGTRPDHSPYSYVARSLRGDAARCQMAARGGRSGRGRGAGGAGGGAGRGAGRAERAGARGGARGGDAGRAGRERGGREAGRRSALTWGALEAQDDSLKS